MKNANVKIAKELVRLAKILAASADDAGESMVEEFLEFFKRDFEYSDENVTITFNDKSNGSLYGNYSLNVDGDCTGVEALVNDLNSKFGRYFQSEVARNMLEEIDSSKFIDYVNALIQDGISEEEAHELAVEKLTTFVAESHWGNAGPNNAKIYCNGSEAGEFDFFGMLYKCCIKW